MKIISFEDVKSLNISPALCYVWVVTRYPERKPSLDSKILLFNADSGEFLALMDGNWITAMRTGAVAAHSVLHLAKSSWNIVSMIGLGNVARSSLLVLSSMAGKAMTVRLLRYTDQAELFVEPYIMPLGKAPGARPVVGCFVAVVVEVPIC